MLLGLTDPHDAYIRDMAEQPIKCADCGATISDKVSSYSQKQFGRPLCIRCQHQVSHIA